MPLQPPSLVSGSCTLPGVQPPHVAVRTAADWFVNYTSALDYGQFGTDTHRIVEGRSIPGVEIKGFLALSRRLVLAGQGLPSALFYDETTSELAEGLLTRTGTGSGLFSFRTGNDLRAARTEYLDANPPGEHSLSEEDRGAVDRLEENLNAQLAAAMMSEDASPDSIDLWRLQFLSFALGELDCEGNADLLLKGMILVVARQLERPPTEEEVVAVIGPDNGRSTILARVDIEIFKLLIKARRMILSNLLFVNDDLRKIDTGIPLGDNALLGLLGSAIQEVIDDALRAQPLGALLAAGRD